MDPSGAALSGMDPSGADPSENGVSRQVAEAFLEGREPHRPIGCPLPHEEGGRSAGAFGGQLARADRPRGWMSGPAPAIRRRKRPAWPPSSIRLTG